MKIFRLNLTGILVLALFCIIAVTALFSMPVSAAGSTKLSKTSVTLEVGQTTSIKLLNASGTVKWATSDKSVCRYSKGNITATGEGKAYISAVNNGVKFRCVVRVTPSTGTSSYEEADSYEEQVSAKPAASSDTLNIRKGDKVKVKVITDFYSMGVSVQNSKVVSVSTAASSDHTGFVITVKGKSKGTSEITVYNAKNKSQTATIKVNVGDYSDDSMTISMTGNASSGSSQWSNTVSDDRDYVEEVINMVNKERKSAGLSPLSKSSALCSDAAVRAEEITRKFSHVRPDGTTCFTAISIPYGYSGENIAKGQRTPEDVMDSWMNSDGHRSNILSSNYDAIGVGYDSSEHTWVQIFISYE